MNYVIESFFTGIYTCIVYLIFRPFIKNFYILLLVVGFAKHYFGSTIGLWIWYCNNGEACVNTLNENQIYTSNTTHLIRDSIIESIVFLLCGQILLRAFKSKMQVFFALGCLLHIVAENVGIHKQFCEKNCSKK